MSALSSKDLDKCELLTDTHLEIRPSNLDNMKFEYSPLGSTINKSIINKLDKINESNNKLVDKIDNISKKYPLFDPPSYFSKKDKTSDLKDLEFYSEEEVIDNLRKKYDDNPNNKLRDSLKVNKDGTIDIYKVNESIIDFKDDSSSDNLFDKFDNLEVEGEKLNTIHDLITNNKSLSNRENKNVYNETVKFCNLKKNVVLKNADLADISLLDSDLGKDQKGSGVKVYTPSQLITRLPILMGQLKAGNNSIDLINEIRQIIYLLYRNNMISKHIYNHLIDYASSNIKSIIV